MVEEMLRNLHLATVRLNIWKKHELVQDIFGQPYGPLANFGVLIDLGYAYQVITQEQFDALKALQKIRNEAAHCAFEFRLSDDGITPHIAKLPEKRLGFVPEDEIKARGQVDISKWEFIWRGMALHSALQTAFVNVLNKLLKAQTVGEFRKDWPELEQSR